MQGYVGEIPQSLTARSSLPSDARAAGGTSARARAGSCGDPLCVRVTRLTCCAEPPAGAASGELLPPQPARNATAHTAETLFTVCRGGDPITLRRIGTVHRPDDPPNRVLSTIGTTEDGKPRT